jgi:hypothetical protein
MVLDGVIAAKLDIIHDDLVRLESAHQRTADALADSLANHHAWTADAVRRIELTLAEKPVKPGGFLNGARDKVLLLLAGGLVAMATKMVDLLGGR